MGCANSLVAAVRGHEVALQDVSEAALAKVPQAHVDIGDFLVGSGYCSPDEIAAGLGRIHITSDLTEAVGGADLISESVFERLDEKRSVHTLIDAVAPPHAIQTTNTSYFLVSELVDAVQRSDRFAALHSHLGALLFDIVPGPETRPAVTQALVDYVTSLGGTPLVLDHEHRGYVFNAINAELLAMALRLVVEDRATPQSVDAVWMQATAAPMGPFGMMDLFGLDLLLDRWHEKGEREEREAMRPAVVSLLEARVGDGAAGMKSGRGFYTYPDPEYQSPGFVAETAAGLEVYDTLLGAVLRAAACVVAANVVDADGVDRAWIAATHMASGPFQTARRLGGEQLRILLNEQVAQGMMGPDDAAAIAAIP